jgi:hypothetical protein
MKKYFLFIAAILILGSGCKKSFLSVNEVNPNTAVTAPGNLILPAALSYTAAIMNNPKNWDFVYLWYGIWSISGGYTINADLAQYNIRNSSYQGNWDNLYLAAKAFDDIEKASNTTDQAYTYGMAKIMKAYIFQNLVDMYGDVPYSQAFQGVANLKPKYDAQQGIYEDLIVQIDAAIAAIKGAPNTVSVPSATQDIMYAGNATKWIKFANTLKLRILMHQSNMTGRAAYITSKIAGITGGYIGTGEGAMVNPGYLHSSGKTNPTWAAFYNADASDSHVDGGFNYYSAGTDMLDYLYNNPWGDLRVYALYTPFTLSNGAYAGNYFAVGPQRAAASCSGIGTGNIQSYAQSAIILSDFESLFLQSEAAQRGWIGVAADASTYYYAAVKASYTYLGLTSNKWSLYSGVAATTSPNDYNTWLIKNAGDPTMDYTAATNKIQLIVTQKWVALSGNTAVEIWTDFRRTGFPNFIHWSTDAAKKNPTPPIRLLYTQNEISRNGDNVPQIGRNTADLFAAKIFWNK